MTHLTDPVSLYYDGLTKYAEKERLSNKRCNIISRTRFLIAIVIISIHFIPYFRSGVLYFLLLSFLILIFCILVVLHSVENANSRQYEILKGLNKNSLRRINGEWMENELPKYGLIDNLKDTKSLLIDLNVLGENSLLHYIGTIHNSVGYDVLLSWLKAPAKPNAIKERQASIQEFSNQIEHRQKVQLELHKTFSDNAHSKKVEGDYQKVTKWANTPTKESFLKKLVFTLTSFLFPISIIVLAFLFPAYLYISLLFLLLNIFIVTSSRSKFMHTFNQMSQMDKELGRYAFLCKVIDENDYNSANLRRIKSKVLSSGETSAYAQLKKLSRLVAWSELRYGGIFYLIINFLVAFDFHIYSLLNNWKRKNGKNIRKWIQACGEYEVLLALSETSFNNPTWCFPHFTDENDSNISATALGHPLIGEEERVDNNLSMGPEGNFILVTGSNMSGKTTLLRAIGINILLARTGSPVCAKKLGLPFVDVVTSFRVTDSLSEGVSLFMAELQQIKKIINIVKQNSKEGILSLALLDEILQGTNSQERHLAVIHILKEILGQKCIGVISTHDINLASSDELKQACKPIYFREELKKENGSTIMLFDYKLRDGISDTKNALKLLEAVGLKGNSGMNIKIFKSEKPI